MADPDELLDVYDERGTHLGTKGRAAVHRDGDWHRCVHLWVLSGDAVLLQRRAMTKGSWPGMLDATAAGHVGAGESVEDGGAREIREELGVAFGELVPLGMRAMADHPPGMVNREFQHVLLAADPRPLEDWTAFDRVELDGLVRLPLAAFTELVHTGAPGPWAATAWDGIRASAVRVRRDEVLMAAYLRPLTIMLERFARGERPLAI